MAVEARTGDSPRRAAARACDSPRRAEPALVWSAALIRPQGQPRADCAALEQPITRNLPHLCPSRRRLAALNGPSGEYSGRSRVRLERRATDRTLSRARRAQVCILLLGGSRPRTQDTTYERAATAARRRRFFLRRPCCSAGRAMPRCGSPLCPISRPPCCAAILEPPGGLRGDLWLCGRLHGTGGAALRHLAPPPTRTRAPSPALATRLHGTERILRALVPCCRAYCTLDAKLSDVILFAAPRSAPAAARARAPPLLRSNPLNFMALQIRVGA